jgi:excinuclease UvrABC nuclease subunit
MKCILPLILLFTVFGCRESATQPDPKPDGSVTLDSSYDQKAILEQIAAFHIQQNSEKKMEYALRDLKILAILPVTSYFVDSIKHEVYRSSQAKVADNIRVRTAVIENLKRRVEKLEKGGRYEDAGELRKTIDNYKARNDRQATESLILAERDSIVGLRLADPDTSTDQFFQVDYYLMDQISQMIRKDTTSLIFRSDYRIEDLLEDRAWEP